MYLNKITSLKKPTKFKNRTNNVVINNVNNYCQDGLIKVFCKRTMNIELKIYSFFFFRFEGFLNQRRVFFKSRFICNDIYSKKSKNSRMGKGKGKMFRFTCRLLKFQPIFIFNKISKFRIKKFFILLNKKYNNKFFINICLM
jgi:hypothetical protein